MARSQERVIPGNARKRRRWPIAVALPIGVGVVLIAVLAVQYFGGTSSKDPLTVNGRARDAVVTLEEPQGWTRTDVRIECPDDPEVCKGGSFRTIGIGRTEWVPPASRGAGTAALEHTCDELAAAFDGITAVPPVDVSGCVAASKRAIRDKPADATADTSRVSGPALVAWTDTHGSWLVTPIASGDGVDYAVALQPAT